ncbi:glycosyltransferase [Halobellus sp. GM3]|uniref:glycosyltransferase n=1 Tax=Halobellus sp. GM3 TaxID=3458410 RepID=UPI00403D96C2
MYKDNVVGVVIPAYNEAGFVGEVIETLPPFVDRAYVIDDCSTDSTWAEIKSAAARVNAERERDSREATPPRRHTAHRGDGGVVSTDGRAERDGVPEAAGVAHAPSRSDGAHNHATVFDERIRPIRHEENRGVGGAIKTGYQRALADEIDIVAVMGGDGQMRPEELHRYLDPIVAGEVDYAKGNRLLNREHRREMSSWRLFGNWVLTFLTKVASGYWRTMDPQNGYTAISREALESIEVDRMYEDYGYCNDLLVRLNVAEQRVGDVPQRANYGDEESSIRYRSYIPRVSQMLLRDFLWRLRAKYLVRRFHPLALLYGLGGVASAAGTVSLVRSAVGRDRGAGDPGGTSEWTASALLVALGWLSMLLAMVFDIEENADREQRFEE